MPEIKRLVAGRKVPAQITLENVGSRWMGGYQPQSFMQGRTAVQRAMMDEPISAELIEDGHTSFLSARITKDAGCVVEKGIRRYGGGHQQDEAQE